MNDEPTTEGRLPEGGELDRLPSLELVRRLAEQDARAVEAVREAGPALAVAIEAVAERFTAGGRLVYAGAGTSGRLGLLDAVEQGPTFGLPAGRVLALIAGGEEALTRAVEGAEDDVDGARERLLALELTEVDVLVGIAASGRTPWVLGALDVARTLGALTIGIACVPGSALLRQADLAIELDTGPELISGSTRLKAGTATKLALNALSTGVMVRTGRTYGDLMVDLRATNEKLRRRAAKIVSTATGLTLDDSRALLERCDGEVKTAILVERLGFDPEDAREQLEEVDGHLRDALGE
ncbi:MAG: N-acetylmuramic acid 6-phosphate etherase [Planctomycetota bacterium]